MQMNRIEIAGYLAAKPELRYLPSGTKVANARLGETYRFVGQDGKPQSHTNWHSLVFYNNLADVALTYEQGENIHVEGSLQQRKFKPAEGANRTVHEIHVRSCHVIAAVRISQESVPAASSPSTRIPGRIQEGFIMTKLGLWRRLRTTNLRKSARIGLAALSVCLVPFVTLGVLGIRINTSPSLPLGLYMVTSDPKAPLVEFCPEEPFASFAASRGYRSDGSCPDGASPLMKPIVAQEGDLVRVTEIGLIVNGRHLRKTAPRSTDTKRRPMRPWPVGAYRVTPGSVWVASSYNSRSFDSRYFGPVAVASIRAHLRPLLTVP